MSWELQNATASGRENLNGCGLFELTLLLTFEREETVLGDNDVIEQFDVDHVACEAQPGGEVDVIFARHGISGREVMHKDDSRRVV